MHATVWSLRAASACAPHVQVLGWAAWNCHDKFDAKRQSRKPRWACC